jgi:hypothetical protein
LIVILLVGSLAWMVWWAVGQGAYEQGLNAWIKDRRTEGWAADVGTLETRGFPNRFDTTLTDLRLADPETGVAWAVPMLQILSLAYKPHQVILVVAENHRFSTPVETLDIRHEDARASLFLKPEAALGLDRAVLILSDLGVAAESGWDMSLASGRFAAESVAAADNTYRIGAEVTDLALPRPTRRLLDPAGVLPKSVGTLHLDATLAFDRPWDRHAIEEARPQPTAIDLSDLSARWGDVTFRAAGKVAVGPDGYPEGEVAIRAVEWRKILDMAVASGVLPESARAPLENGLSLMSGPKDTLDVTLGFDGGFVRLGVIPIGPAPQLVIR